MPCSPNQINIDPSTSPGIPIPGFGLPFSPIQIPLPNWDLPTDLIEDLLGLMQKLGAIFPSGKFKANLDLNMKSVMDFIGDILSQIAPFLSLYNFFMAVLKLITCVIEVLCAIPNPFAVAMKLKKLFMECLPPFINLFPWLALIAMIIALLLLILALIEFIIATIMKLIEDLIRNLKVFYDSIRLHDSQSILAALQKFAAALCFLQNIMAVFIALAAIIAIIKSLAALAGFGICSDEDQDGCCPIQLCPPFVKNTPDGIKVTNGKLIYRKEIGTDASKLFPDIPDIAKIFPIPTVRPQRWQLLDTSIEEPIYPINSIIVPIIGNIFWPDPLEFKADTQPKKAPYTVDLTITLDPITLGQPSIGTKREFIIKDCIVVRKPYFGTYDHLNNLVMDNLRGTLNIEGGLVFEADGETKVMIGENQATLNTLIYQESLSAGAASDLPSSEDGLVFDNISFVWKPNAPTLAGYNLITVGCIPEVSVEKAVQNAIIFAEGIAPVLEKMKDTGVAPDVEGAQACISNAVEELRKDISEESIALFSANSMACMDNLKKETIAILNNALRVGVSQFKSEFSIDTDLQFIRKDITASVILKDPSGTSIASSLPEDVALETAKRISANVTLGKISNFTYNGEIFTAKISSEQSGEGELSVTYDGKVLSKLISGDAATNSSIQENILKYTFVGATTEPAVRRDNTDIGNT